MKRFLTNIVPALFFFSVLVQISGCGMGGEDLPFIFEGDGTSGGGQGSGSLPPPSCNRDTDCPSGQTCNASHQCEAPARVCEPACANGQICNTSANPPLCRDPNCNNPGELTCPTGQRCTTQGSCENIPTGNCNPVCTSGQICDVTSNQCRALNCNNPGELTCPTGQRCNAQGSCENIPTGSCNPACLSGEICDAVTNQCRDPNCTEEPALCDPQTEVCDATSRACRTKHCGDDSSLCGSGLECNTGVQPPRCDTIDCRTKPADYCGAGSQCNATSGQCELAGACNVDFHATLALKIDSTISNPHFDSPPPCCEYSGPDGSSTCSTSAQVSRGFLQAPSENTDLFCCAASDAGQMVGVDRRGNQLYCDTENRHGVDTSGNPIPQLAVTLWPSSPTNSKMRLRFAVTDGGNTCVVSLPRDEFPQFRLENSALEASLVIDAGKDYRTLPPQPSQDLNPAEIEMPCQIEFGPPTTDPLQREITAVRIPELPFRFFVQLFQNYTQYCVTFSHPSADPAQPCPYPGGSFNWYYYNAGSTPLTPEEGSFQIIPGFDHAPIVLTTESREVVSTDPAHSGSMLVQGQPLHFDPSLNETRLTLATALSLPDQTTFGSNRNDQTGAGQLLSRLSAALLSARIDGRVTKVNSVDPIRTLADLTTDCGGGTTPPPTLPEQLDLSVRPSFNSVTEEFTISGDPTGFFSAEVCVQGNHSGNVCNFSPSLPFAKDVSQGDPVPGLEAKYQGQGTTVVIENTGITTATTQAASLNLTIPSQAGAFKIVEASSGPQNVTLAPGNNLTLTILFEPDTNASATTANGCTTTGNVVSCQSTVQLAPSLNLTLKGQAKTPASEIRLEEIDPVTQAALSGTPLLPNTSSASVNFEEARLGVETKTKLYKLSNTGVRPLNLQGILVQDGQKNFRLGSISQGADFQSRIWKSGINGRQSTWIIPPGDSGNFFFFVNYGPVGQIPSGDTRADSGTLEINTDAGAPRVALAGSAKKDRRATLALYVEDPNRFARTGAADLDIVEATGTVHLYLARFPFFSLRQDSTDRAVYLVNNETVAGIDNIVLYSLSETLDPLGRLSLDTTGTSPDVAACFAAVSTSMTSCAAAPLTSSGNTRYLKLGTLLFNPLTAGTPPPSEWNLRVRAVSQPVAGGSTADPKLAGGQTYDPTTQSASFAVKGANNAQSATAANPADLVIRRLLAGYAEKVDPFEHRSLIVSTTTPGIAARFASQSSSLSFDPQDYAEVFTLPDRLELDPVNGIAKLKKIVTAMPASGADNRLPRNIDGVRLFNAPGTSVPRPTPTSPSNWDEYYVQCKRAGSVECSFFYLYIGEWSSSTTPRSPDAECPQGHYPVVPDYLSGNAADLLNCVYKPETNLNDIASGLGDAQGTYDPVTGELTFPDLAIRLYSPSVPVIGSGRKVDATIRLALTTECVSDALVSDQDAKNQRFVAESTLRDNPNANGSPERDVSLLPEPNPLLSYVNGSGCDNARTLHGRRMFAPDFAGTLDDHPTSPTPLNLNGFDLAGVGHVRASESRVNDTNMYIVIKAEIRP